MDTSRVHQFWWLTPTISLQPHLLHCNSREARNDWRISANFVSSSTFISLKSIVQYYANTDKLEHSDVSNINLTLAIEIYFVFINPIHDPVSTLSCSLCRFSNGAGNFSLVTSMPQMSLAYSVMVRSLENLPEADMFMIIICNQRGWSCMEQNRNIMCFHWRISTSARQAIER